MIESGVLICLIVCSTVILLGLVAGMAYYRVKANEEAQRNYREEERTRRKEAELHNDLLDIRMAYGAGMNQEQETNNDGLSSLLTPQNIALFASLLGGKKNVGGGDPAAAGSFQSGISSGGIAEADNQPPFKWV